MFTIIVFSCYAEKKNNNVTQTLDSGVCRAIVDGENYASYVPWSFEGEPAVTDSYRRYHF